MCQAQPAWRDVDLRRLVDHSTLLSVLGARLHSPLGLSSSFGAYGLRLARERWRGGRMWSSANPMSRNSSVFAPKASLINLDSRSDNCSDCTAMLSHSAAKTSHSTGAADLVAVLRHATAALRYVCDLLSTCLAFGNLNLAHHRRADARVGIYSF